VTWLWLFFADRRLFRVALAEKLIHWTLYVLPLHSDEGREFATFVQSCWMARALEDYHRWQSLGATDREALRRVYETK
jgi:hypothetical protein